MYKRYQDGGQAPQDESQMIQAILQAIQQLSPEGQQMLMQQLMGEGQAPEQAPEEQYIPPQARKGGMQRYM